MVSIQSDLRISYAGNQKGNRKIDLTLLNHNLKIFHIIDEGFKDTYVNRALPSLHEW